LLAEPVDLIAIIAAQIFTDAKSIEEQEKN